MRLFLDCDGVLADFDKLASEILGMAPRKFEELNGAKGFWKKIRQHKEFYFKLEPMEDALELHNAVKHLKPTILTGKPFGIASAEDDKIRWAKKHFGEDQEIIVCFSRDKSLHMEAGDIIIDDWPQHRKTWEDKGGIWIHHTSAKESLAELKKHLDNSKFLV